MKEPLTIAHLADGEVIAELNRKIQDASAALDATDNPKAVAKISLDIKLGRGRQLPQGGHGHQAHRPGASCQSRDPGRQHDR